MSPRLVVLILAAGAILCTLMASALAQQPERHCGPLKGVLDYLNTRFDEFRIFTGEVGTFHFVVTRAHDGNWTLIRTEGEAACIVATGEASEVDRGL